MNTCNDNDVCHPSHTKANGNPVNIVSGASVGNAYHHLVMAEKEIIVSGITIVNVSRFMFPGHPKK